MQRNDWTTFPQSGWVQELERFFPQELRFLNFAKNGRSTKSFIAEGRFYEALAAADEGDIALIQFGHNDEKFADPARYTSPDPSGEFRKNLEHFITEFQKKGVLPVLLSPMARRKFENGILEDTHGNYPNAVIETAKKLKVPAVDMSKKTFEFLKEVGEEKTRRFFMNFEAGVYENFPEGKSDNSHLRADGAFAFARLAATEFARLGEAFPAYKDFSDAVLKEGLNQAEFEKDTGDERGFA